jgi:hypothetical protein
MIVSFAGRGSSKVIGDERRGESIEKKKLRILQEAGR